LSPTPVVLSSSSGVAYSTTRLPIGLWIITCSPKLLQPTRNVPFVAQFLIRIALISWVEIRLPIRSET
ncbi:unnamed protein product, partial [Brassica oleracea]